MSDFEIIFLKSDLRYCHASVISDRARMSDIQDRRLYITQINQSMIFFNILPVIAVLQFKLTNNNLITNKDYFSVPVKKGNYVRNAMQDLLAYV